MFSTLHVIVGGDSRLGQALDRKLAGQSVVRTSRRLDTADLYLDLLDPKLSDLEFPDAPRVILYLVAAMTGVVQCERDPDSWRVNADAPALLALAARDCNSRSCSWRTVFVSSDAVECAPHTAYAKQKAHAESVVLSCGGRVVRPARIGNAQQYEEVAELLLRVGVAPHISSITRWIG